MKYYKPELNPQNQWVVRMEMVDGKEQSRAFSTEVLAKGFIKDELGSYAETGLTKTQQDFVQSAWDKLKFDQLTRETFNDANLDGRSKQGRLIKRFLAERKLYVIPGYLVKLPDVVLSSNDKEFIRQNAGKDKANALDIARDLFGSKVVSLSKEHRAVDAFIKTLPASVGGLAVKTGLATDNYEPPKTYEGTIKRINKYNFAQLEKDKITTPQKKGVDSLTCSLSSPRFLRTINAYQEQEDRDSFESEFIRHIWDKYDLTAEDLNLYINLCADYIMMFKIQAQIESLDQRLKDVISDPQGEITMRLTEAISVKTQEYDKCFDRHRRLAETLSTKRADRLKRDIRDNASVLSLVQAWKNEEDRLLLLRKGIAKEQEVMDEVKRLESLDEFKARILGIGVMEAIHGL